MIVVNFFGAPNSGKSTAAGDLFPLLKRMHLEVEYVQELTVKLAHYTKNHAVLKDELFLFADKNHHLESLRDAGVQVAITDGPLLNSLVYKPEGYYNGFDDIVKSVYGSYNNINIFIDGIKPYSELGRGMSPDLALAMGDKVKLMLDSLGIEYYSTAGISNPEEAAIDYAVMMINKKLNVQYDHSVSMTANRKGFRVN